MLNTGCPDPKLLFFRGPVIPRTIRSAVAAATVLAERPGEMVTRRDPAARTGVPGEVLLETQLDAPMALIWKA